MFIHTSEIQEMICCSFLNLITALVHQLSGISWKTRELWIYEEHFMALFRFHNFPSFNTAPKKWTFFDRINEYLAKCTFLAAATLSPIQVKAYFKNVSKQVTHVIGDLAFLNNFLSVIWNATLAWGERRMKCYDHSSAYEMLLKNLATKRC